MLIILESTTYPGTTDELVLPILAKSGSFYIVKVTQAVAEEIAQEAFVERVGLELEKAESGFERSSFSDSRELAQADVRVATFWKTVPPALHGARCPVFHLCQGYEGGISFYRGVWPEIEEIYRKVPLVTALSVDLFNALFAAASSSASVNSASGLPASIPRRARTKICRQLASLSPSVPAMSA